MENLFDQPLFVFEMANNHMGSEAHGIAMIDALAKVAGEFPFHFALKFQFRDLDSFIHPHFQSRTDVKYVNRFRETQLSMEQFKSLKAAGESWGWSTMCTPFDEPSVDRIEEMGFDIIKIASCSFADWPLLERIVKTDKPLIASTAGARLEDIDRVVSFFQHRAKVFALMHCVGEYPTGLDNLQLNQIDLLKKRYLGVPIGYSTHEKPDNMESIQVAIAKGACIFEKHVAVETHEYKKNDYSATPEQIRGWLAAAQRSYRMCGIDGRRPQASDKELADLRQFKRGVFAGRKISRGEKIDFHNALFAFPCSQHQLLCEDFSKYSEFYAQRDYPPLAPLLTDELKLIDKREKVYSIVQKVRKMLAKGNVVVPGMATLEISHHYGLEHFDEVGCSIINIINREYCKKYIILFPGQKHPEQYHKVKEETFVVLQGDVQLTLDGVQKKCKRGDVVTVGRGIKHPFTSERGAVIEEISSTHLADDSYYTDEAIQLNPNRKTVISYWME